MYYNSSIDSVADAINIHPEIAYNLARRLIPIIRDHRFFNGVSDVFDYLLTFNSESSIDELEEKCSIVEDKLVFSRAKSGIKNLIDLLHEVHRIRPNFAVRYQAGVALLNLNYLARRVLRINGKLVTETFGHTPVTSGFLPDRWAIQNLPEPFQVLWDEVCDRDSTFQQVLNVHRKHRDIGNCGPYYAIAIRLVTSIEQEEFNKAWKGFS